MVSLGQPSVSGDYLLVRRLRCDAEKLVIVSRRIERDAGHVGRKRAASTPIDPILESLAEYRSRVLAFARSRVQSANFSGCALAALGRRLERCESVASATRERANARTRERANARTRERDSAPALAGVLELDPPTAAEALDAASQRSQSTGLQLLDRVLVAADDRRRLSQA